jgi:hypothetical protein
LDLVRVTKVYLTLLYHVDQVDSQSDLHFTSAFFFFFGGGGGGGGGGG